MIDSLLIVIGNKLMRDSIDRQKRLKEIIKNIKTESKGEASK